jgi:hypothetical protein
MSRNLLPRFRSAPNPVNIPPLAPGRWSPIQAPAELAKLEFPADGGTGLRTRIQSIPSPWARLHLFRNALEDPDHPARTLVQNEILDALELTWSLGSRPGVRMETLRIRIPAIRDLAEDTGSPRVRDFADALIELAPRRADAAGEEASGLPVLTLALVGGRPLFASSPYTFLFTAEDAAREDTPNLFRYATGAKDRPLAERPLQFQRYVARVVLPQLSARGTAGDEGDFVDWPTVQRCVTQWLSAELARARAGKAEKVRDQLTPPEDGDWATAARALGLEPLSHQKFGGVVLFTRPEGGDLEHSRWRLRVAPESGRPPIVIDPESFDGLFYEGASLVQLPPDLPRQDRTVLPGLAMRYPWVHPAADWLTEQILLLSDPLDPANVKGLAGYRVQAGATDPRFAQPRMALPLTADFFRYFTPDDVDRMLSVDVLPSGGINVTLAVQIGTEEEPRELRIKKHYTEAHVRKEVGPGLVLWPAFRHPDWHEYALFREDRLTTVSAFTQGLEVSAMVSRRPLAATGTARRTEFVAAQTFADAPDVLEFRAAVGAGAKTESLGVVLPRLGTAAATNEGRWHVGVDFGTSNTVVSVRRNDDVATEIFQDASVLLPLTRAGADTENFLNAFFFPPALRGTPFGTAVVHLGALPNLAIEQEPLGLRVNIPFDGWVKDDGGNRVTGDLKWSNLRETAFLSSSFLRTLVALVLSSAIRSGVSPKNVSFTYSRPRAFDDMQAANLADHWQKIVASFSARGIGPIEAHEGLDESQSVLQHFFNAEVASTLGAADVILDVGGGTTDLAAYGHGKTLILDSVQLGGRDLTGARARATSRENLRNPFVDAFVRWALENGFPASQKEALAKYRNDGQEHLAFSFLVRSRWFGEGEAVLFRTTPAYRDFQALVFYFFGALFHYAGLSLRAVREQGEPVGVHAVILAGNGSRYLDWLTNLRPGRPDDRFRTALRAIFAAAAGIPGDGPVIVTSDRPKEEVARGLVARDVAHAAKADSAGGPLLGERLVIRFGDDAEPRHLASTTRLSRRDRLRAELLGQIRWEDGEMEIERFHANLIETTHSLLDAGEHWAEVPAAYKRVFDAMGRDGIRQAALTRLQTRATGGSAVPGSFFILEAAVVLQRLMDAFFGERP